MITADLTGRVALVTGGASGIGLVAVELFAHCGATVAMNSLADDPRAEQERERLSEAGLHVIHAPGNVAIADEAQAMVEEAIAKLGRLDILINNAATPGAAEPIEFANLDAMTEGSGACSYRPTLLAPSAAPELQRARLGNHEARLSIPRPLPGWAGAAAASPMLQARLGSSISPRAWPGRLRLRCASMLSPQD